MEIYGLAAPALGVLLAPLLLGLINRVKSVAAGRTGPPVLQAYFDLVKLLRKGSVYSPTTTWVFRAGPTLGLAAVLCALLLLPVGPLPSAFAFAGDLVVFAALLALQRFTLMGAALDTGSSFEGMGASREALFASVAEPALVVSLLVAARGAGSLSLSGALTAAAPAAAPGLFLVAAALFVVALAENARIPVDDPNTHLELTMVHEAMVLDHSGPGLAYLNYAGALKLWVFCALCAQLLVGMAGLSGAPLLVASVAGTFAAAAAIGGLESATARLRLLHVPRLLVGAGALAALAFLVSVF